MLQHHCECPILAVILSEPVVPSDRSLSLGWEAKDLLLENLVQGWDSHQKNAA
jgi:hypothetical protein